MTNKEKIIEAAISIFSEKGMHGAKMEEIGLLAKVNKAMVYYYFGTKENLYCEVLRVMFENFHSELGNIILERIKEQDDPVEVISKFLMAQFDIYSKYSCYPRIFFDAFSSNREYASVALQSLRKENIPDISKIMNEVYNKGVKSGKLRELDFGQVMFSIMGVNIVYHLFKPFLQSLLRYEIKEDPETLEQRKIHTIDLIMNGILVHN